MLPYSSEQEARMRRFSTSLNEKDRRLFAGFEALQVGYGGRNYIAKILGCSRNTVSKGAREVSGWSTKEVEQQIRAKAGGVTRFHSDVFENREGAANHTLSSLRQRDLTRNFWTYCESIQPGIRWMSRCGGRT